MKVQPLDTKRGREVDAIVLHENGTVCMERSNGAGGPTITVRRAAIDPTTFVRRMAKAPKTLDLLDIVAGGNGLTGLRQRGLDATTGMEDPSFSTERRFGDGKYHLVTWHKLIDGVFTPSGKDGAVVVDSAGHTFAGFPSTARLTDTSIWARAAEVTPEKWPKNYRYWVYAMGSGRRYMPGNSGLLGLDTSMGITFDLQAVRAPYGGVRPGRFRATLAMADARSAGFTDGVQVADVWVLVDGRPRLSRLQLRPEDGLVPVDIELGPQRPVSYARFGVGRQSAGLHLGRFWRSGFRDDFERGNNA